MFTYFLKHVEDESIRPLIAHCQSISKEHIHTYMSIFEESHFPIPRGMTSEDIHLNAPRLYTDIFYLNYIKGMSKFAIMQFSDGYTESTRSDIRSMFISHLHHTEDIDKWVTNIMLKKGIYIRPPSIPTPKEAYFVEQRNPFTGFYNRKRPLSVLEISQLFHNSQSNALGKALLQGFSQVAESTDVRKMIVKGIEISSKAYKAFSETLMECDLPALRSYDAEVFDSSISPFSDRLMLYHVTYLNAYGIGRYGMSLSQSPRNDLATMYTRIMGEVGTYAHDCATLLIKNNWMEEPPLAPDRRALVKGKQT